jgi:ribosomal-protein-alanine N-acetyltransferase
MIIGKRVTLGPIIPADLPALFCWSDDLDAARLNAPYRPSVWKNEEEFWSNVGRDSSKVFFAIRAQGNPAIIGYVQIFDIDAVHRSALVGLRIGEVGDRGRGYGTEAMALAVAYCWSHLNLSRIGLVAFETNERAIKLYTGLGFEKEGLQRRAVFIDGQWVDLVLMSLLHPSRTNGSCPESSQATNP